MKIYKKYKIITIFSVLIGLSASLFLFKEKETPHINIVLITVDTLRPDHLGCYGYKRNTSPNIDKLAKEGVLFTQAISQGMNTFISIPSIITSTYPYMHGVLNCGDSISPLSKTFTEILKTKNYSTALISGYDLFAKIKGLDRGFDMFKCKPSFQGVKKGFNKVKIIFGNFFRMKPKAQEYCVIYDAREITRLADKWVTKSKNKAFFLWVHYFEVHGFYKQLPLENKKMFLLDDFYKKGNRVLASGNSNDVYTGFNRIPYYIYEEGITDSNYYIAQYDAAIRYVDEQIGILLEKLKKLNIYNNTIVIITADHGESLGEHNFYLDHASLYDDVIKIPLIVKLDGVSSKNLIISEQVQSIDIIPTLLDSLKIESPNKTQGMSLLQLISGKREQNSECAFTTSLGGVSIRTKDWKLIHDFKASEYELYNLSNDPGEVNNLVSVEKDRFEYLRQKLSKYELENFGNQKRKAVLDTETKEKLKSFGYIQ